MIPAKMRAAVLVEPGRFEIREIDTPEVGAGDVLINVKRAGVCGTDLHIFRGHFAAESIPLVPGHELAGVVAAVGRDVTRIRPGDRVASEVTLSCGQCFYCRKNELFSCSEKSQFGINRDGGFAEYVAVPERLVIPIGEEMSFEEAALVEPLACCVRAFDRNDVRLGESVVVIGAGPIGNLHVQLARLRGAAPIIVVDLNRQRLDWAKEVGADIVLQDPEAVEKVVARETEGRGADIVIESVGNARLYEKALSLVRPGGKVIAFGVADGEAEARYHPVDIVLKELSMRGTVASFGDDFHTAIALLRHKRIKTDIFTRSVYPLEKTQQAVEDFMSEPKMLKVQIGIDL